MRISAPGRIISPKLAVLCLSLALLAACQSTTPITTATPELRDTQPPIRLRISTRNTVNQPLEEIEEDVANNLWGRIRSGFKLEPAALDNPRIDQQRLLFANQPRYFEITGARAERYLHYVVEQLDARNMPLELALLPFIESGYNPMAYSHAHAAGMWQFIPSTGQIYNLQQDWWYDGRRDITASTQAALDYLTRLNTLFDGDWLLALAAYNCGEGCVGRAVKRNQELGLPTDYWNLQLPRETMNYVPKLLALSQIIHSPVQHGTELPELANTPYFSEVTINHQLDLNKAAELANMPTSEFLQLNPAFKQRVTAPGGAYQLLVPVDRAEQFSQALAALPANQRVNYQHYRVRSGDTLSQIASRHQLSVRAIQDVNRINGHMINVGQVLMLPIFAGQPAPVAPAARTASSSNTPATNHYRVRAGDSLWTIARQHGTDVATLRRLNRLNGNALRAGQQLQLPATAQTRITVAAAETSRLTTERAVTYTVKQGDSLYSIARQFNVGVQSIRAQNKVDSHIQPGQQLTLLLP